MRSEPASSGDQKLPKYSSWVGQLPLRIVSCRKNRPTSEGHRQSPKCSKYNSIGCALRAAICFLRSSQSLTNASIKTSAALGAPIILRKHSSRRSRQNEPGRHAKVHFVGSGAKCLRKIIGAPRAAEVLIDAFVSDWEDRRNQIAARSAQPMNGIEHFGDWQ